MSDKRYQQKVSVIVPTRNRVKLLPQLIEHFKKQTWGNKELLIFDDTPEGEAAVEQLQARNPNIHIRHSSKTLTIGTKRNKLIEHAKGELIAHFDDDDYYSPSYLETLVQGLLESNSDLNKLTGWFCLHEKSGTLGYWDTTRRDLAHTVFEGNTNPKTHDKVFSELGYRSFLTGYGFSFLYRKQAWRNNPFEDINLGEDSLFLEGIRKNNGRIHFTQDTNAICIHIIHRSNTSRCFPNHIIPKSLQHQFLNRISSRSTSAKRTSSPIQKNIDREKISVSKSIKPRWGKNAPTVSICTLTHNRGNHLRLLQRCIESQDYPPEKIEWMILDDSDDKGISYIPTTLTKISIKYQKLSKKLILGKKRNLSHQLCSGEYIVYMDDDDYYYPSRISHAVSLLQTSGKQIAGSSLLLIYFCHDKQLWISGPFGMNHATANTFAMTKEFARSNFYNNTDTINEEKFFLKNYRTPMAQLDPTQTIICISHSNNTFDKKRMRSNGSSNKMRPIANQEQTLARKLLKDYQKIYEQTKARH